MDITERLKEFFRRLEAAPPASTAEEALALVCRLIEEVEDDLCPLPRQEPPPSMRFTGRMYAPKGDRITRLADGTLIADARRHRILCRPNGGISVIHMPAKSLVLYKKGKDERAP